jgi:hypothetical protein
MGSFFRFALVWPGVAVARRGADSLAASLAKKAMPYKATSALLFEAKPTFGWEFAAAGSTGNMLKIIKHLI